MGVSDATLQSIKAGDTNFTSGSAISQTFTASAGSILTFDWKFLTDEGVPSPFDFSFYTLNDGAVRLGDTNMPESAFALSPTPYTLESPPTGNWDSVSIIIPASGTYTLGFAALQAGDQLHSSALLVDNVNLRNPCQLSTGCKAAGKSLLLLKKDATDDTKDKLTFKWLKGADTTLGDLGNHRYGATIYSLCLYAGSASAAVSVQHTSAALAKGFKYKGLCPSNGVQTVLLKTGTAGKAKVLVKGKGSQLPDDLVPALALPVTAQVVNNTNNTCFEAVYNSGDVIKNDGKEFKAKK